jgi:thymidylate synthase (FAD)
MGSDLSIVNAARVSFHKESDWEYLYDNHDGHGFGTLSVKDQKLINYLATHNHWTPFAHAFMSFRIKAPIFVARQLVKHQVGLVWNEVSRRYVDDEPEFWFPMEWRGKPVNAKQGSSGDAPPYAYSLGMEKVLIPVLEQYNWMIETGVAPEQARMVLPLNCLTEWIWSGSLVAFARVCKLRLDPHAQLECQEVAKKIYDLVPDDFEHSWSALMGETK